MDLRINLIRLVFPCKGILISVFVMLLHNSSAQNQEYRSIFTDAEYYLMFQDYKEALPLYLKLSELNPNSANISYRIGLCYLNLSGFKNKAIPYLVKSSKRINRNYQEGSYKEEGAPLKSLYFLGEAYMIDNQLERAIDCFNQFRNSLDTKDISNLEYVDQQIKACKLAKEMIEDPVSIHLSRFDLFPEQQKYCYFPVVSKNGHCLVFTVKEKFYDAIYYAVNTKGVWVNPKNITLDLGVEGEVYATSLNAEGNLLLLFKNEKSDGNIYLSKYANNKWGKALKLEKHVNSKDWETFASFSPDGNTIYFTSNRKGGIGGLDIYYTTRAETGTWSTPQNLGKTINTPYNEESPFLSADGKTLYFASQGHNSMGGFDLFFSKKLENGVWANPINLGYPISTTDDNLFYYPIDSLNGMISSIRSESPSSSDICHLTVQDKVSPTWVEVKGLIQVADNMEIKGENFLVELRGDNPANETISAKPESITGNFSLKIKAGTYRYIVSGISYESSIGTLAIPKEYSQKIIPLDITLTPKSVASGEFVAVKSILFDFDSYVLSREASIEIEKVQRLMFENPGLSIKVTGHTDSKGSALYNQRLSEKRARAVIDYLVSKGIDESRFVAQGVGALVNAASNTNPDGSDNPTGRSLNRRVCMSILKSDKNIVIDEDVNVPEHLRPHEQSYTILLQASQNKIPVDAFNELQTTFGLKVFLYESQKDNFYTIGSYPNKPEALRMLNHCLDNGFQNATIAGLTDLQQLLRENRTGKYPQASRYTILLKAQSKPMEKSDFKGMRIIEHKGRDGFFRYIHGDFVNLNDAKKEVEKLSGTGFSEAFIISVDQLKKL